jgi:hypothetical protein
MAQMMSTANPALFGGVIPMQSQAQQNPLVDPSMVQADITGMWGAPTVMPQMNPMQLWGMGPPAFQQNPFPWNPYLGGFK